MLIELMKARRLQLDVDMMKQGRESEIKVLAIGMYPACQGLRLHRVRTMLANGAWIDVTFSLPEQDRHTG